MSSWTKTGNRRSPRRWRRKNDHINQIAKKQCNKRHCFFVSYFCQMLRICALVLAGLIPVFASGQVRLRKLTIGPKEVYELQGSDIIVVDTLVMMDSSRLILNT